MNDQDTDNMVLESVVRAIEKAKDGEVISNLQSDYAILRADYNEKYGFPYKEQKE